MIRSSIIVPTYNCERYLTSCVLSIFDQDTDDYEAIVIDDGSNDSTGVLVDESTVYNERLVVIHQQNAGVSVARNSGIEFARGEFITFCDADDRLSQSYLRAFNSYSDKIDLVVNGFVRIDNDGSLINANSFSMRSGELITREFVMEMLEDQSIAYVFSKRFKTANIINNNIRFNPSLDIAEDTLFVCDYLSYSKSVSIGAEKLYQYRMHSNPSLSKYSSTYYTRICTANDQIISSLEQLFPGIRHSVAWKKWLWRDYYYSLLCALRQDKVTIDEKYKSIKDIIDANTHSFTWREIFGMAIGEGIPFRIALASRSPILLLCIWLVPKRSTAS